MSQRLSVANGRHFVTVDRPVPRRMQSQKRCIPALPDAAGAATAKYHEKRRVIANLQQPRICVTEQYTGSSKDLPKAHSDL